MFFFNLVNVDILKTRIRHMTKRIRWMRRIQRICRIRILIRIYITLYNQMHNILRLFNDLPNFPFTTSETMRDYYL